MTTSVETGAIDKLQENPELHESCMITWFGASARRTCGSGSVLKQSMRRIGLARAEPLSTSKTGAPLPR